VKRIIAATLLVLATSATVQAGEQEDVANARGEALTWLRIWDAGNVEGSRNAASAYFRNDVSIDDAKANYEELRRPLGTLKRRTFKSSSFNTAPDGEYLDVVFDSDFGNKNAATETVELVREADGAWKVSAWLIR